MNYINFLRPRLILNEFLLGVGLGSGYMTSLRFLGPIGVSEILIFLAIFQLLIKGKLNVFSFQKNEYGFIKLYMLASVFVLLPITTLIFSTLDTLNNQPMYILSFIAGTLLSFLLAESIKNGFNMANVTLWFAIIFILSNLLIPSVNTESIESLRYQGAANNPNQLLFYASSVTLLLIIYNRIAAIFYIPFIIFIMLKVKSDAYTLSLIVSLISFTLLKLILKFKTTYTLRYILILMLITLLPILVYIYNDFLTSAWVVADEGGSRTTLMYNGLLVTLNSPIIGYGAGSFSSMNSIIPGKFEAHNTFLDLSMQFGLLFPLIIYYIFMRYFFYKFNNRKALDCAFFLAFIISGLFHFSGRHFIFWVELGVFMSFIYSNQIRSYKPSSLTPLS